MAPNLGRAEASLPQSSRSSHLSTVQNTRGRALAFRHPIRSHRAPCGRLPVTGQSAWQPGWARHPLQERPAQLCAVPPEGVARTCRFHDASSALRVAEPDDRERSGLGALQPSVPAGGPSPLPVGPASPPQAARGALPIGHQTSQQAPTLGPETTRLLTAGTERSV